ncbi:MAG: PIG-L family deacetylase [Chloroflexi bacterium]|nr:PIG-L family deacetylase [Chloroflexota bacterium]
MATVLAISAHPDDELFGAGYLAKLVSEGHDLYLLCTTRGEGGEVGEPPVGPKSRLGEYREVEMRGSAAALGARDVWFLDFVDPWMEIGGEALAIDAGPVEFCAALAERIGKLRPDVVLTHGSNGEYGHPQHIYTHRAVLAALGTLAPWTPSELLTWCANDGKGGVDRIVNEDDRADITLDISPWFDRKLAAANAHVSQHAMFVRNNKVTDIADALRRDEAFKRWPTGPFLAVSEIVRPGGREVDTWR